MCKVRLESLFRYFSFVLLSRELFYFCSHIKIDGNTVFFPFKRDKVVGAELGFHNEDTGLPH